MPSSVIELFNYNHQTARLTIIFRSGNVYVYEQVPADVYYQLQAAPSKGRYFNQAIRDKYTYKHLNKSEEH